MILKQYIVFSLSASLLDKLKIYKYLNIEMFLSSTNY